ncbi:hypothetical protein BH11BAC5_BH11BAC5_30220 [soil metagenome]
MKIKRIVIAIYTDPDFYPPTINAILNIAASCDEVIVISRNNSLKDFNYPVNVLLKKVGKFSSVRASEQQPLWKKLVTFIRFTTQLLRYSVSRSTNLLLVYDQFALLSFFLVKGLIGKKKVWYHSHDMLDRNSLNKYSIGGFAAKYESVAMRHIHFFSLPARERLAFYTKKDGISFFVIPNYPSLKVYKRPVAYSKDKDIIKIIFQGFIGAGHALETLLVLLKEDFNNNGLHLVLKGSVTDRYKSAINGLADQLTVSDKVTWLPIGPYSELPAITASCHLGIGINMNTDAVSSTQGTASNKIYEYAASGLPVIVTDSTQFKQYLDTYTWVFFTDGSVQSLHGILNNIIQQLPALGASARKSFEETLNFEHGFCPAWGQVMQQLKN